MLAAGIILQLWPTNFYSITPGHATPVGPLVKVRGLPVDSTHDTIMLTDVYVQKLSLWQWLVAHTQSPVQIVTEQQLLLPGIPPSELIAQGYLQMYDAKEAAEVAAFRALGWKIPTTGTGVTITGVVTGSPAWRAGLRVGDQIIGVGTQSISSACAMVRVVHHQPAGTTLDVKVKSVHISPSGHLSWARASTKRLVTARGEKKVTSSGCSGVSGTDQSYIGVTIENSRQYTFPARITINTADIGGPSAGLAMTLTILDELSRGSLTGGQRIAATGTMSPTGQVGQVGGVAEKAVAVANAGATYFLVPAPEVSQARSSAPASLHVIGVRTLSQVLTALRRLGGGRVVALTRPT